MRILLFLTCLIAVTAKSAPFVVADVVSGVSQCGVFLDAQPKVTIPVTNNECRFDVGGVSNGNHSIRMTAIAVNDPVWGSQESAQSAPFAFAKPGQPTAPGSLRLEP